MPLWIGGGMLAGSLIQGGLGYLANREQGDASADATRAQLRAAKEARDFAAQQAERANWNLDIAGGRAADALSGGYNQGIAALEHGNTGAAGALGYGRSASLNALTGGYGQANDTIRSGMAGAQGQLQQGYGAAQRALSPLMALQQYGPQAAQAVASNQRLDGLMRGDLSRENAYAGFEADPGYQFRLQQGEQAINRAAAAQGGRYGGRTLQALQEHGQGLASQEYDKFAQRRSALNAMQMQGAQSGDASQMQAALQAQQNQMGLAGIGYNAQGQSADMQRQLGSQLAGLTTAGSSAIAGNQAAAGQGASGIESAYGSNLANLYATGGQQLAGMHTGLGSALANVGMTTAGNQAANLTGVANTNTQLTGATLPGYAAGVPYAGAGLNAIGQTVGNVASNLGYLEMLYGAGGQPNWQTVSRTTQGYGGYSY